MWEEFTAIALAPPSAVKEHHSRGRRAQPIRPHQLEQEALGSELRVDVQLALHPGIVRSRRLQEPNRRRAMARGPPDQVVASEQTDTGDHRTDLFEHDRSATPVSR